jgi:uncharacterized protein YbaA (DUF1428 family)
MTYIDGFVAAVPQENKQAYLDHVREALSLFKDHGATRMVENWGDDVPAGKVTDFHRAVQKRDGEAVLFSWVEWPSKDVRDYGTKALEHDDRMKTLVMPFDGQRMIYGGFSPIVEKGSAKGTGYVDGIAAPVPLANRAAYINMASAMGCLFREYGALRVVEGGATMYQTARSPISAARWKPARGRPSSSAGSSGLPNRCEAKPGPS